MVYTITVRNDGPDDATGVVVDTKIGGGKLFSSSGDNCAPYKGKLRCDLGGVTAGTSETFTLTVSKNRRPVTVTSTVSSATADPDSSDNSDSVTTGNP